MSLDCLTWSNCALFCFFNSVSCFSLENKTPLLVLAISIKYTCQSQKLKHIKTITVFFVKISFSKLTHSHPLHLSLYRTYSGNPLLIPEQEDPDTCMFPQLLFTTRTHLTRIKCLLKADIPLVCKFCEKQTLNLLQSPLCAQAQHIYKTFMK